jgi:hypothetical protein
MDRLYISGVLAGEGRIFGSLFVLKEQIHNGEYLLYKKS